MVGKGMSKLSRWADKVAVDAEPGLTSGQMMVF